ncbi:uncharacterized protein LOC115715927 [Cannabis sativa]|uniref:uncharacterized protein LOC115715927 n=1 Tax=Cannabis sativa TaxID=3483 RepID=UPI0029CA4BEB|nr:uncharacterized protein LOC115715927 [Cannabis sativa]
MGSKKKLKDHPPSPTFPAPSKRKVYLHSPSKRVSKCHRSIEEESNSDFELNDEFIQLAKVAKGKGKSLILNFPTKAGLEEPSNDIVVEVKGKRNREFGSKSVANASVESDQVGPSLYKAHEHVTHIEYEDLKKDVSLVLSHQRIIMSTFANLNKKMDTLIGSSCAGFSHRSSQIEDVLCSSENDDDVVGDGENEDDEEIDYEENAEPRDDDVDDNANDCSGDDGPNADEDGGGRDDCGQSVFVVES